jgi:KDO2-lipid IV(A) lauroyltransferase
MRSAPTSLAGVRALLRALRSGEAVGLLPDQVPSAGDGVWTEFFGAAAYSMTLPQRLAVSTGATVVLAVGERLGLGRGWRLHLRRLDGPPSPAALNRAMEVEILRLPTQYLWGYNRFKRPAGAPAPGDDGAPATVPSENPR